MPLPLSTARLRLRALGPADAGPFAAYRNLPAVARYQSWELPYGEAQAADLVAELAGVTPGAPGEWYQVAIALAASDDLIGDCAFCVLADDPRQAELGFTLAPAHQGQGYATEAVARLRDYLFEEFGLHRIRANCDAENGASARVLERVGMRREAHMVESLWFKGRWASELWYAILRREWEALRTG